MKYWDFLTLGEFYIPDQTGKIHECIFKVKREQGEGFCDLFVYHEWTIARLNRDKHFIDIINRTLRAMGYRGKELHSAESGMQSYRINALEGNDEFKEFIIKKLEEKVEQPKIIETKPEDGIKYTLEFKEEEVGYSVSVKELYGCLSQGDTLKESLENIGEAIEGWLKIPAE